MTANGETMDLWQADGRLNLDAVDRRRFTVTTDTATGRSLITPNVKVPSHPGATPHEPRVPFTRAELWRNDGELWLRSIVVDTEGRVLSCGFPKFFELIEVPEMEPEVVAALKVSEAWLSPKLDGTLAIATILPDDSVYWRTRGALDFGQTYRPEYAAGLEEACERPAVYLSNHIAMNPDGYLTAEDLVRMNGDGYSFLFELTGPCNGMAVCDREPHHTLTFLAAVRHPGMRGNAGNTPTLEHMYPHCPQPLAMRGPSNISIGVQPGTELGIIRKAGPEMGEGFVIILPDARMVKVKTEWYMLKHHLLDRMTPRIIGRFVEKCHADTAAELEAAGYDRIIHAKAFKVAAALLARRDEVLAEACAMLRAAPADASQKEIALWGKLHAGELFPAYLFPVLVFMANGDTLRAGAVVVALALGEKTAALKGVRPTGPLVEALAAAWASRGGAS